MSDKHQQLTATNVELQRLKTQMKAIQSDLNVNKDIGKSLANTREQLDDSESTRKSLQDKITQMAEDFEKHSKETGDYLQSIIDENNELRNEVQQTKDDNFQAVQQMQRQMADMRDKAAKELMAAESEIKELNGQCLARDVQNKKQEAQLHVKKDVEKQLEQFQGACKKMEKQNTSLQKELKSQSDYISQIEEKMYKANVTSLELLRQLKEAEQEVETLKSYIIDLKGKVAVYIPIKDDPIDEKLADFINNYPDRQRLKIMFMRESVGVYEFGSKKVLIKVEKDKIKIRVGGGFLSIDEFLDQFTPVELQKLERRDPLKRFSEKVVVQKTTQNHEIA